MTSTNPIASNVERIPGGCYVRAHASHHRPGRERRGAQRPTRLGVSTSVPFALVDVFADAPLAGNPLPVVADAERLPTPVMQAIARELSQSETTFVLPPTRPEAAWRLRSFTPAGA